MDCEEACVVPVIGPGKLSHPAPASTPAVWHFAARCDLHQQVPKDWEEAGERDGWMDGWMVRARELGRGEEGREGGREGGRKGEREGGRWRWRWRWRAR
eukprot:6177322-Pleurochrysis_carterae.AAC.2